MPNGALADTYSDDLILAVINQYFNPVTPLTTADIATARQRGAGSDNLALLTDLFRYYELEPPDKPGPFDKVTFAHMVKEWLLASNHNNLSTPAYRWVPAPLCEWLTQHAASVATHRKHIHSYMAAVVPAPQAKGY